MITLLEKASEDEYLHRGCVNEFFNRIIIGIVYKIYNLLDDLDEEAMINVSHTRDKYRFYCFKIVRIISFNSTNNFASLSSSSKLKDLRYHFRLNIDNISLLKDLEGVPEELNQAIRDLENIVELRAYDKLVKDLDLSLSTVLKEDIHKYDITPYHMVNFMELSYKTIRKGDIMKP